jgi:class 3 adenylate cyclase
VLACAADVGDRKLAAFLRKSLPEGTAAEIVSASSFSRCFRTKAPGAFVYFLASGLGQRKLLSLAAKLEGLEGCSWGVLDPAGESEDPAAYFFAGARDYLGPRLLKSGPDPSRTAAAFAYASSCGDGAREDCGPAFEGWEELAEGEEIAVRFCYAALADQEVLAERVGETRLGKLREEFASFLETWSKECGGILWIRDSAGCLLLFPPRSAGANPVLGAFRLLLDRALIGYEAFHLAAPLSFRFAFHAGQTIWKKPGATGTIVSKDVNYAFHLGQRAAGDGLIVVSAAAVDSIPSCLGDFFAPAGSFEGRILTASRRFED